MSDDRYKPIHVNHTPGRKESYMDNYTKPESADGAFAFFISAIAVMVGLLWFLT